MIRRGDNYADTGGLLETLEIQGCLVTADAMSCQKQIASKIQKKGADYLLAVKKNQRTLYQEIDSALEKHWASQDDRNTSGMLFTEQENQCHGRDERRRCWVFHDMPCFPVAQRWQARTVAAIQLERSTTYQGKTQIRYFISSRILTADEVISATRSHWRIENSLH